MDKDVFFKFYANLPIGIRKEIVLHLDKEGPITWEVAYKEMKAGTKLGDEIFEKLIQFGFLPTKER